MFNYFQKGISVPLNKLTSNEVVCFLNKQTEILPVDPKWAELLQIGLYVVEGAEIMRKAGFYDFNCDIEALYEIGEKKFKLSKEVEDPDDDAKIIQDVLGSTFTSSAETVAVSVTSEKTEGDSISLKIPVVEGKPYVVFFHGDTGTKATPVYVDSYKSAETLGELLVNSMKAVDNELLVDYDEGKSVFTYFITTSNKSKFVVEGFKY